MSRHATRAGKHRATDMYGNAGVFAAGLRRGPSSPLSVCITEGHVLALCTHNVVRT